MSGKQVQNWAAGKTYERVLSDRDVRLILESTVGGPKSANQIILESNIAPSTAYRKLKKLVCMNILKIEYAVGVNRRWEMRYRSNLHLSPDNA